MPATNIGARLKAETATEHQATEELLLGKSLRERSVTLGRYRKLIAVALKVWSTVEHSLQANPAASLPELDKPITTLVKALEQDAKLLKLLPADVTDAHPIFEREAELLGSRYVLLGSTLGGRMIAKLLPQCPGLANLPAFHFYTACGELPRSTWALLQQTVEKRVKGHAAENACIEAARKTFNLYRRYY